MLKGATGDTASFAAYAFISFIFLSFMRQIYAPEAQLVLFFENLPVPALGRQTSRGVVDDRDTLNLSSFIPKSGYTTLHNIYI
jgi:hypothetical protein